MSFLFNRNKSKPPQDLVKALSDVLHRLDSAPPADRKKYSDDASKLVSQLSLVLSCDPEEPTAPAVISQVYASDVLELLVTQMSRFEFDSRKDIVAVFAVLLRKRQPPTECRQLVDALLMSHANPDIALSCGLIVRDCVRHANMCRAVLQSNVLWALFDTVANAQFELATDAFSTITCALTSQHAQLAAEFLTRCQEKFVNKTRMLLSLDNYVTQRQTLKLLSTLLTKRQNYAFMTAYVSDAGNLRPVMVLLRNKSPIMRFEAFQIFKIFVANPKKSLPVTEILYRNKARLVEFLKNFTSSPVKKDDETFNGERMFIISQLLALNKPVSSSTSSLNTNGNSNSISTPASSVNLNTSLVTPINTSLNTPINTPINNLNSSINNPKLEPQLINALGSGSVLSPIVQTDQVLSFSSSSAGAQSSSNGSGSENIKMNGSGNSTGAGNGNMNGNKNGNGTDHYQSSVPKNPEKIDYN